MWILDQKKKTKITLATDSDMDSEREHSAGEASLPLQSKTTFHKN